MKIVLQGYWIIAGRHLILWRINSSLSSIILKSNPNPNFGEILVVFDTDVEGEMNIFNIFGVLVRQTKITGSKLNEENLLPGTYIIKFEDINGKITSRKMLVLNK